MRTRDGRAGITTAIGGLLAGAFAGAAGTTALNATTYADMTVRGRAASNTEKTTAVKAASRAGVQVPGDPDTRSNRFEGLGALSGIATGVLVGAVYGLARISTPKGRSATGWLVGAVVAGTGAMALADGVMAGLGVSDPRKWSSGEWLADAIPHAVYGLVTAGAVELMEIGS
jgi:hypothetical protein